MQTRELWTLCMSFIFTFYTFIIKISEWMDGWEVVEILRPNTDFSELGKSKLCQHDCLFFKFFISSGDEREGQTVKMQNTVDHLVLFSSKAVNGGAAVADSWFISVLTGIVRLTGDYAADVVGRHSCHSVTNVLKTTLWLGYSIILFQSFLFFSISPYLPLPLALIHLLFE